MSNDLSLRIQRVADFQAALRNWFDREDASTRSYINQNIQAVRREVFEAGCLKHYTISPPPIIGGLIMNNVDLFNCIFNPPHSQSMIPELIDMLDETIGVMMEPGYGEKRAEPDKAVVTENASIQRGYVFIAMPMAGENVDYEDVHDTIKLAAQNCGLNAERVDEVQSNERITDRLLESIRRAEFVIADLTDSRPNVFYEAGYAFGLGKTPIYVASTGTKLEFDLKDYPVIFFKNMRELRTRLEDRLRVVASRGGIV